MTNKRKIKKWYIPDWVEDLSPLLGDIRGKFGVVNPDGTISLRGDTVKRANEVSKYASESDDKGPGISISGKGSLL